jgi:Protein of unknown function (DUF2950)
MRTTDVTHKASLSRRLAAMMPPALLGLFVLGLAHSSLAQTSGTAMFPSPEAASQALVRAVQNRDERTLETILGAGPDVTSTGDDSVDTLEREQFSRKYREMHRFVREPDGRTVLYIGAENWPFPIPLISRDGKWSFDPRTGSQEILFRKIGENEATVADVCRTLTSAQQQHQTTAAPIHGYYFRALNEESRKPAVVAGSQATTGKKMTEVVFVAYPVEYRSSGVMTFVVTKDGVVYQRDLGPETSRRARDIQEHSKVSGWTAVN